MPGAGLSPSLGHFLKTVGPSGAETAGMYPTRLPTNRGNAYIAGTLFADRPRGAQHQMAPNFDCKPSGGETYPQESSVPGQAHPGCIVDPPLAFLGNTLAFTHINPANYHP